jgi:transposase-like protein
MTIDFSLNGLLDEQKCYDNLVEILHSGVLCCPNGHSLEDAGEHKKDRAPIITYRCKICGRFYNVFTATVLQGTRYNVVQINLLLRGIVQGETTARLAREISVDRKWLLGWRHKLQNLAFQGKPKDALLDTVVESDEMYQNAGEKRRASRRSNGSSSKKRQQAGWTWHLGK